MSSIIGQFVLVQINIPLRSVFVDAKTDQGITISMAERDSIKVHPSVLTNIRITRLFASWEVARSGKSSKQSHPSRNVSRSKLSAAPQFHTNI
jgi:hypothetical protein